MLKGGDWIPTNRVSGGRENEGTFRRWEKEIGILKDIKA